MVTVGVGGNYGFFNLLTIALALTCLDDRTVYRVIPSRFLSRLPDRSSPTQPVGRIWQMIVWPVAIVLIALNSLQLLDLMSRDQIRTAVARVQEDQASVAEQTVNWLVETRQSVRAVIGPFALVNGYGLFRTMTKSRPELQIEGSLDGQSWKLYGFKYKPSKATDSLYAGFHMPRLDWHRFTALYRDALNSGFLDSWSHSWMALRRHWTYSNTTHFQIPRLDMCVFVAPILGSQRRTRKTNQITTGRLRRCEIIAQ